MKLDLSQLSQSGATDGQAPLWDDASSEWVPGTPAGGGGGLTVQDENGNVATGVTQLDFQGAGVSATAGTGEVVVTIAGGGGGSGFNPIPVDDPANWSADLGYDYEFGATSSALPAGWAWFNQGSGTYAESFGAGVVSHPGQVGDNVKGVARALPTEATWTATAKVALTTQDSNYVMGGILLHDTVSGKATLFGLRTTHTVAADDWASGTAYSAVRISPFSVIGAPVYFRVKRNSATSWDFLHSNDGVAWRTAVAGSNLSTFMTPNRIGFGVLRNGASQALVACHWFRVR